MQGRGGGSRPPSNPCPSHLTGPQALTISESICFFYVLGLCLCPDQSMVPPGKDHPPRKPAPGPWRPRPVRPPLRLAGQVLSEGATTPPGTEGYGHPRARGQPPCKRPGSPVHPCGSPGRPGGGCGSCPGSCSASSGKARAGEAAGAAGPHRGGLPAFSSSLPAPPRPQRSHSAGRCRCKSRPALRSV